jgi:hypothetical protein
MILRSYHHIIFCKNELGVSTNIRDVSFLQTHDWPHQLVMERIDCTQVVRKITDMAFSTTQSFTMSIRPLRYMNSQPRGQLCNAYTPS